jgi:putative transposase
MTDASRAQGQATIERLCRLAGVSRAGFYRYWQASAPRVEETGVCDALQRAALENRRYGYRRLTAQLKREGWAVNHKRVLRLMREDNLLCGTAGNRNQLNRIALKAVSAA